MGPAMSRWRLTNEADLMDCDMARTGEHDISSSTKPRTIKYRTEGEAQSLYAAAEREYAICEFVDASRSDWMIAVTGMSRG